MVARIIVMIALCACTASAVGLRDIIARMSEQGEAASVLGGAVDFDGASEYFTFPHGTNINFMSLVVNFGISFWCNPLTLPTGSIRGIVSKRDTAAGMSWELFYNQSSGTKGLAFWFGNNAGVKHYSGALLSTGVWSHVVMTRSGDNFAWYVNGSNVANITSGNSIVSNAQSIYIGVLGGDAVNTNTVFHGAIDDVSFWGTYLYPSNVASLYNSGTGKKASSIGTNSLVCYWSLNDGLTNPNASNALDSVSGTYATGTAIGVTNGNNDWVQGIVPQ